VTRRVMSVEVASGLVLKGDIYGDTGAPVILLHGGGQTRHSWRATAAQLEQAGFTALPFDARGHGDSGWAADERYTFFDYALDVRALAAAVAQKFGQKPAAVGASLGGMSSLLATAGEDTNPLAALVLVDVTPRLTRDGVAAVQGFMRSKAKEGFATVEDAAAAIAAYLPHRPKPRSLDGLTKNLRQRADGRFYWHWDPAFLDGKYPIETNRNGVEEAALAAAASLAIPSLLVRGQGSELVSMDYANEYLRLAKGSEFVDVAEARHMVAGDNNTVFADAVVRFLSRVMRPTAP
jgi:pimeloyl-ACP methyl ester carboxylesterase